MRYSLRTLFIILATIGIFVAMSIAGYQSYLSYEYKQAIGQIWDSAPVASSRIDIEEVDDIILGFDGEELTMIKGAILNKRENGNYDLDCSSGKYRIIYYEDIYRDATIEIDSTASSFEVIKNSLMLTENSPISSAPLWAIRSQFMPMGCTERLQHFESGTKMGIVSGTFDNKPNTVLFVFDKTGYYSIGLLLLEPTIDNWDQLAARLRLVPVDNGR